MLTLAADDETTQRMLLRRMLTRWGHQVVVAKDGTEAWEALCAESTPRIAILDWNMPGLNGVDVCKKLKAIEGGPYVYTILITHGSADDSAQIALDSGADDFLRKPLDLKELRSRIGVGLRVIEYDESIKKKSIELERYATQMEELAADRAKQLAHAERMVTLGLLSAGVAHEINNPATFISGNAQTLKRFWKDAKPWLENYEETASEADKKKLAFIQEEFPKALSGIQQGVKRIAKIVKGLKAYSGQNRGEKVSCDVNQCMKTALELCQYELQKHGAQVQCQFDSIPRVFADEQQLEQVFVNLLVNASHAMETSDERSIKVSTSASVRGVCLLIEDTGPGIPQSVMKRIFDPFFTTKKAGQGTGLGLSICRDIITSHEGTLEVTNLPALGAQFRIELPACKESDS